MRVAVPNTRPSWVDSHDHLIVVPGPGGFLDAAFSFVLLTVDAPGIDPQQHVDAVTGPFSDLRCGHSGVQPSGDRRVAQIVGASGQQRCPFLAVLLAWPPERQESIGLVGRGQPLGTGAFGSARLPGVVSEQFQHALKVWDCWLADHVVADAEFVGLTVQLRGHCLVTADERVRRVRNIVG